MAEEHIPWSECIRHLLLLSCVINIENTQRASYLSVNSAQFFQVAEKSVSDLLACMEDLNVSYAMEPGFTLPNKYDSDVTAVFKPEVGYLQLSLSDWRKIRVGATSKRCLVILKLLVTLQSYFTCKKDLPVQLFSY